MAEIHTTPSGEQAVLTLPATLTPDDVRDLRDWLAFILVSLERRAAPTPTEREPR